MKPTQETFSNWLRGIEFNSPQDCYSLTPYQINSFELREKSIYVDYDFLVVDSTIKGFEMFEMVESWLPSQQFPKFINRVRIKELYTWETTSERDVLSYDYSREPEDVEYSDEPWDSPAITDQFLESFVNEYDRYSIGEALVENCGVNEALPAFVPNRLCPIFRECVNQYKITKSNEKIDA